MKRLPFLLLFISICFTVKSQNSGADKTMDDKLEKMHREIDSSRKALDTLQTNLNMDFQKTADSINSKLEMDRQNRNFDAFYEMQKEQKAKQLKGAYLRIGFGLCLLGVFIYGIRRRKKEGNASN